MVGIHYEISIANNRIAKIQQRKLGFVQEYIFEF